MSYIRIEAVLICTGSWTEGLIRELQALMKRMDHPNIIKLMETFEDYRQDQLCEVSSQGLFISRAIE